MTDTVADLEKEKSMLLDQYMSTSSELIKRDIEQRIEDTHSRIHQAMENKKKMVVG